MYFRYFVLLIPQFLHSVEKERGKFSHSFKKNPGNFSITYTDPTTKKLQKISFLKIIGIFVKKEFF